MSSSTRVVQHGARTRRIDAAPDPATHKMKCVGIKKKKTKNKTARRSLRILIRSVCSSIIILRMGMVGRTPVNRRRLSTNVCVPQTQRILSSCDDDDKYFRRARAPLTRQRPCTEFLSVIFRQHMRMLFFCTRTLFGMDFDFIHV